MRRLAFVLGILFVLAFGGFVMNQIGDGGVGNLLPFLQQTNNPEASTAMAEPWQVEQFFILIGFVLVNMIGIGLTIALIMWFLNRQVAIVRAEEKETE